MKKLQFSITIDAPREKVWETITNKESYEEWTKVFEPTSSYRGEWKTGSKIMFVSKGEDGAESGMLAEIAEARHPEFISIRHLGMVNNGVEDTTSEEVQAWAPAYENYTLTEVEGGTELTVDQDMMESYEEMFTEMWPKALEKLKEMSETK